MAMISCFNAGKSRGALMTFCRTCIEFGAKRLKTCDEAGAGHGLVFPSPSGVAAAFFLVVGKRREALVTNMPELPLGRSAVSISNKSPSEVLVSSQVMSLRTNALYISPAFSCSSS